MRRYETIFILRPDLADTTQKETIRRFGGIVGSSGGELIEADEWGFRELAYNLKGERRGFYVRLDYGGTGATMNEVERNMKLSDTVLRYLSVLVDRDSDPAKVRSDLEAHRRRTAEARAAAEAARAAAEAARAAAAEAAATGSTPHEDLPEEVPEQVPEEAPKELEASPEGVAEETPVAESEPGEGSGEDQG
jgi:small subunit ribosomal protein S6